jgi:hypothetical protein
MQAHNSEYFGFDVIVSHFAEPILGCPNVTELNYQSCNTRGQIFGQEPTSIQKHNFIIPN